MPMLTAKSMRKGACLLNDAEKGKTMDDLISRKALIAEYDRVHIGPPGGARKLMEDAPAVDAVEVVRCKDCVFYTNRRSDGVGMCFAHTVWFTDDNFCSYGERKDNE